LIRSFPREAWLFYKLLSNDKKQSFFALLVCVMSLSEIKSLPTFIFFKFAPFLFLLNKLGNQAFVYLYLFNINKKKLKQMRILEKAFCLIVMLTPSSLVVRMMLPMVTIVNSQVYDLWCNSGISKFIDDATLSIELNYKYSQRRFSSGTHTP
jgi:hypothetical protein